MGLVHHQPQQLHLFARFGALAREQPREVVAQHDGDLHVQLHAPWIQVRAVEDQLLHPPGVLQREAQGDVAAVGEAQDVGRIDILLVHEGAQILGELADGEGRTAPGRRAVAASVQRDHAVGLCEEVELAGEVVQALAVAVQQDQRVPRTLFHVVQLNVTHALASLAQLSSNL